LRNLI
jgi:hypothetical protein